MTKKADIVHIEKLLQKYYKEQCKIDPKLEQLKTFANHLASNAKDPVKKINKLIIIFDQYALDKKFTIEMLSNLVDVLTTHNERDLLSKTYGELLEIQDRVGEYFDKITQEMVRMKSLASNYSKKDITSKVKVVVLPRLIERIQGEKNHYHNLILNVSDSFKEHLAQRKEELPGGKGGRPSKIV